MLKINNKKIRLTSLGLAVVVSALIFFAIFSFAASPLRELSNGEFILNVKEGQIVDLAAKEVAIAKLLDEISKQAKVDIKVQEEAGKELVSLTMKDEPLPNAIKKIVGSNYILNLKKENESFEVTKGNVVSIKDRVKEFIGSFVVDGSRIKMFFMSEDSSPKGIAEYIRERHKLLDYLAEKYPDKVIEAQISLKDFLAGDEILAIANKYDIKVEVFNPGWKDSGGGFDLRKDESLPEAIKRLNEYEKEFLEGLVAFSPNNQEKEKYKEQKKDFEEKGATIYGIKLEGKTTELKKIKDEEKQVRLADPLWKGSLYNLLQQTHIVSPIAIPLSPYSDPISDLEK
ncbi:MAG: hypothetical protein V1770_03630 [bacterium]